MQISKYMLANERDSEWGLTVTTIGYEDIGPHDSYPTKGHADGYYFELERGRVLNEYQLLYNPEGEGIFNSASVKNVHLREGDMFLLFPGEWHSYHPINGGWKSYWIGFKGRNMDERVKAGFLSPSKPVYHIGFSDNIVSLYKQAYDAALEEAAYSQQLMAGIVNHLIGMMYSLERNIELKTRSQVHVEMINRARLRIRESLESPLTIQQVAEELGVSYSNFRKLFKEHTGFSPAVYQQDLRLQRAKELLSTTDMSIKEIAYQLNFESPDYFSAKFKVKTGRRPSELRNL
ncbi:MAG: helix-turn-helix domain-containing protein [Prevotella sp.]|jgi:AraC-like DNA-binding protein|nr:helix-turn-helix domain-containing protein [Prevotella sp.]